MINDEHFKPIDLALQKAMKEPCPYCGKEDYYTRSQLLEIPAGEQHENEPPNLSERNRDLHPDLPFETDNFRVVVCSVCGFTRFFKHPPLS